MELKQIDIKIKKIKTEIKKLEKEMKEWGYIDVAIDSIKRNREVYKLKASKYLRGELEIQGYRDDFYNPQLDEFEDAIKKLEKLKGEIKNGNKTD